METENILKKIINTLNNKKAINIKVFYVGLLTPFFDYILIASGANIIHSKSLMLSLEEILIKNNKKIKNIESDKNYKWIIIDCGDILINIFDETTRTFYNLENIWADAKELAY